MKPVNAQLFRFRRELERRRLARQEAAAFRRLGRTAAGRPGSGESPELRGRLNEVATAVAEIEAIAREEGASIEGDRADLARVPFWMAPVVECRGLCERMVLRHRRLSAARALERKHEALGREWARLHGGAGASADGSSSPDRSGNVVEEAMAFGRAVWQQLRAHLVPKAPAVVGMLVGWWIASTYTDSRLRSVLHSVGIGSGGTRVVSGSTYRAMSFWLPLLAAALCAYLGERVARRVKGEG
jgi:hypothetical protein